MSLVQWLKKKSSPLLPPAVDGAVAAANKAVEKEDTSSTKQRRKHGAYYHYDGETRAKIAKYSCGNGNKAAVQRLTSELGRVARNRY